MTHEKKLINAIITTCCKYAHDELARETCEVLVRGDARKLAYIWHTERIKMLERVLRQSTVHCLREKREADDCLCAQCHHRRKAEGIPQPMSPQEDS